MAWKLNLSDWRMAHNEYKIHRKLELSVDPERPTATYTRHEALTGLEWSGCVWVVGRGYDSASNALQWSTCHPINCIPYAKKVILCRKELTKQISKTFLYWTLYTTWTCIVIEVFQGSSKSQNSVPIVLYTLYKVFFVEFPLHLERTVLNTNY